MTNSQPDYERWAELEDKLLKSETNREQIWAAYCETKTRCEELAIELSQAKCSEDQLMLVIEAQDANYTRMFNEIVELKEEITRLRNIPRPDKPHHFEEKYLTQWEYDVDHYESHLKNGG